MTRDLPLAVAVWIGLTALTTSCATAPRAPGAPAGGKAASEPVALQLKRTIRAGITQTDPHYKNRGGSLEVASGTAFTGSFDWHSSVHAHWALLSIGRVTRDDEAREFTLKRLPAATLDRERAYLGANPDFEMPYGRVWLLHLLREMERQPEVRADRTWGNSVAALAGETRDSVLAWLERTRFPDAPNLPRYYTDAQKFRGDHYSWLFAYLFLDWAAGEQPRVRKALDRLYSARIEPARRELTATVNPEFDFLEAPALLAAVEQSRVKPGRLEYGCDRVALPTQVTAKNAHRAGAYIADAWPCAMAQAKGDAAAGRVFLAHVNALVARPEIWKTDFGNVGHWVPQFIWMGIWLSEGRP